MTKRSIPRPQHRALSNVSMCAAMVLVCGAAASAGTDSNQKFGREGTVKFRVPWIPGSAVMTEVLDSNRATLVAQYENFAILEAPALAIPAGAGAEMLPDENRIMLNAGALDTSTPAVKALQTPRGRFEGKAMQLVQFAGPIQPAWYNAMVGTGVEVVTYIPSNSYLVYGDSKQIARLETLATADEHFQWTGVYKDEYRIDPRVVRLIKDPMKGDDLQQLFSIQLVKDPVANARTLAVIDGLKSGAVLSSGPALNYFNLVVPMSPRNIAAVAAQQDVVSIQVYVMPKLDSYDERQDMIISGNISGNLPVLGGGYLAWLASKGFTQAQFTASGFGVDVSDSGIDNGTLNPGHMGLYLGGIIPGTSRIMYNRLVGTASGSNGIVGCDGHGTLNTHIVLGYNNLAVAPHRDAAGYHYGLGVCPFTKAGSSVIFDFNYTSPSFESLQSQAYNNGARISTNSWGSAVGGAYNTDSQRYDALVRDAQPAGSTVPAAGNQEMVICFSAGNSGSGANTIGSSGTAKNVICVGAAENVQAFGGSDGCGDPDTDADSANDIIFFSSRGPCDDGRQKPDIVGPGVHCSGGVGQTATPGATGQALACYIGNGVCGGVSSIFFPSAGQQFYTASSGTSHSCPAVAGGAALVRQFFINQGLTVPSAAMTKAFLMNSARYMTGVGANDNLWSPNQGMGEMNLGEAFNRVAVTPTFLRDELAADMFTATGQVRGWAATIADPTKPTRITLAWTDAPGATAGNSYNNNLDLTVTVGANTYKGNVFLGANSTTGGSADVRNNVESVFIPAGASGPISIAVTAANIVSDGVPNVGGVLDQDFALVAYNTTGAVASPFGSCCLSTSSCVFTSPSACTTSGGVYRGDNTACPTMGSSGSAQTFVSPNVPVAISPSGTVTVTSTVTVAPSFPIFAATVALNISHTYDSDLTISLIAPGGQTVTLCSGVGGSSDNFTNTVFDDAAATPISSGVAPFTGTFRPVPGPLSTFQGLNSNGVWTLKIVDGFNLDGGALNSWSISLTPGVTPNCVGPCYANCDGSTGSPLLNANDFTCFLNAFSANLPYANCDGSTVPPVLNANDFSCFLNAYSVGCP